MGLDVQTSASVLAAAAVVQTVRLRRQRAQQGVGSSDVEVPLLSKDARQRRALKEHAALAKQELSRLWMYRDQATRDELEGYFGMLGDPHWKLESTKDGLEVWRLPGEDVHRIMGVATVDAPPDVCMEYFKDTHMVFTKLFPQIDRMFTIGKVLRVDGPGKAFCHATFKMPMPVGNMAARGVRSRDFVWKQNVTKLSTGNVLVTATSTDELDIPLTKGVVRCALDGALAVETGDIRTSGYYGVKVPNKEASKVWYIVQADPKGFLPKWLVNLASQKQASNALRLAELFKDGKKP